MSFKVFNKVLVGAAVFCLVLQTGVRSIILLKSKTNRLTMHVIYWACELDGGLEELTKSSRLTKVKKDY